MPYNGVAHKRRGSPTKPLREVQGRRQTTTSGLLDEVEMRPRRSIPTRQTPCPLQGLVIRRAVFQGRALANGRRFFGGRVDLQSTRASPMRRAQGPEALALPAAPEAQVTSRRLLPRPERHRLRRRMTLRDGTGPGVESCLRSPRAAPALGSSKATSVAPEHRSRRLLDGARRRVVRPRCPARSSPEVRHRAGGQHRRGQG